MGFSLKTCKACLPQGDWEGLYVDDLRISKRVIGERLEKGLTVLTGILGMLVADGDMDAIENFVLKNPLYAVYRRV